MVATPERQNHAGKDAETCEQADDRGKCGFALTAHAVTSFAAMRCDPRGRIGASIIRLGPMEGSQASGFTPEDVERARRFHRPLYRAVVLDIVVSMGLLAALSFTEAGDWIDRRLRGLPWWAETVVFAAVLVVVSRAVRFPLSFWRGYVHERRYDLSTQTMGGWLTDWAKSLALELPLVAIPVLALIALVHALPRAWPAVAAPGAAVLVLLLGFVAPIVLEPVFNRFEPLSNAELAGELRALARRAGVPVRDILVADASRRTRRLNAYVSGLGRTRRVVLFDTLLAAGDRGEAVLVTAHELAHTRERHVLKGTALGACGAACVVIAIWALLCSSAVLGAVGASGPGDPRVVPFVLLVAAGLELLTAPAGAALSRRWERLADRVSLELTGDRDSYRRLHLALARSNLADLDPPRAFYYLFATHPTPPERLARVAA